MCSMISPLLLYRSFCAFTLSLLRFTTSWCSLRTINRPALFFVHSLFFFLVLNRSYLTWSYSCGYVFFFAFSELLPGMIFLVCYLCESFLPNGCFGTMRCFI